MGGAMNRKKMKKKIKLLTWTWTVQWTNVFRKKREKTKKKSCTVYLNSAMDSKITIIFILVLLVISSSKNNLPVIISLIIHLFKKKKQIKLGFTKIIFNHLSNKTLGKEKKRWSIKIQFTSYERFCQAFWCAYIYIYIFCV